MLSRQDGVEPFLDQPLADPRDSGEAGVQGFHDPAVAPALTRVGDIGLEQNTSLQDRGGGMLALADQILWRRPFILARSNNVLLDHDFRHVPIPGTIDDGVRESENQLGINDGRY
jgi:hypothetical protein